MGDQIVKIGVQTPKKRTENFGLTSQEMKAQDKRMDLITSKKAEGGEGRGGKKSGQYYSEACGTEESERDGIWW